MISSGVSLPIVFQRTKVPLVKSFFIIGVSQEFRESWSILCLMKLKKAQRWENRKNSCLGRSKR